MAHKRTFSGERVRRAREQAGKSRSDLAGELGVSKSYIQLVEYGQRTMVRRWPDLAEALDVPIDFFFVAADEDAAEAVLS